MMTKKQHLGIMTLMALKKLWNQLLQMVKIVSHEEKKDDEWENIGNCINPTDVFPIDLFSDSFDYSFQAVQLSLNNSSRFYEEV